MNGSVKEKEKSLHNERRALGLFPCLILLLSFFVTGCIAGQEPTFSTPLSENKGIPIADEFRQYYAANGGLQVFGDPISEAYYEPLEGRLVQYFHNGRLELDPYQDRVVLAPLGEWASPTLTETEASPDQESDDPEDTLIAQSPPTVQGEFQVFYNRHGGEALFGPPITNQLVEGGIRIQYFENARLEWHPEAPLEERVQVGSLGEVHYRRIGRYEDPGRSRPLDSAGIRDVAIAANFWNPILYQGDRQTIFIQVTTPEGQRPVAGVAVDLMVKYDGKTELVNLPETDSSGQTQGAIPLPNVKPGQRVRVIVTAASPGGNTIGTLSQSFRTWW